MEPIRVTDTKSALTVGPADSYYLDTDVEDPVEAQDALLDLSYLHDVINANLGFIPPVQAWITFDPEAKKQLQVEVHNCSVDDVEIGIVRVPGRDSKFKAGAMAFTKKSYAHNTACTITVMSGEETLAEYEVI